MLCNVLYLMYVLYVMYVMYVMYVIYVMYVMYVMAWHGMAWNVCMCIYVCNVMQCNAM